jgi:hypothetical protein
VLSPFDDFPIHQTAEPIAHVASGDRNAYDRYFFHGYDRAGDVFFGAALGVYPNREVIDASFSVVRGGRQRSVHASGRLPVGDRPTRVGPIRVEVVQPLHTLRVVVDDPDGELGVAADVTFQARTVAVEEPRHTTHHGPTVMLDATRLTQWGDWSGSITVDGTSIALDPRTHLGLRDRSWGIRPIGEPVGGAPSHELPQVFWFWSPVRFDDRVVHGGANERTDGSRWFQFAETTAVHPSAALDPSTGAQPLVDTGGLVEPMRDLTHDITWRPGTRLADKAVISFGPWNAEPIEVTLEPIAQFPLRGLGYINPDWSHGHWKGELVVGTESWQVDELDPLDVHNLHVQQLCRATSGDEVGIGVLEQLVLGPHDRAGLTDFLDGAR